MFKTVNALVLREVRYKEADRILTLLTDTEGKITAKARGALRKSSRTAAATQQLTYSEMTLFENKGRWTVNEAVVREGFKGLRGEMERLALGAYFAECMEAFGVEDQPEPALLQLGLNCLYALSRGLYPPEHIKAAFELRLMCLSGYAPELSCCAVCGKEPEQPVLSLDHGRLCCRTCLPGWGSGRSSARMRSPPCAISPPPRQSRSCAFLWARTRSCASPMRRSAISCAMPSAAFPLWIIGRTSESYNRSDERYDIF